MDMNSIDSAGALPDGIAPMSQRWVAILRGESALAFTHRALWMAAFDVAESATSATSATPGRKPAPNAGSRLSGVRQSPPPHGAAGRHMAEAAADSELRPF
jgi:hypothetical protein